MQMKPLILIIALIACSNVTYGQDRPVQAALTAELGGSAVRNTYLSPLLYEGNQIGLRFERWRTMHSYRWRNQQIVDVDFATGEAESGKNSTTWSGRAMYRYAMHRDLSAWIKVKGLNIYAGPYAGFETGFDYNLKIAGSNNPATARLVGNMGASIVAQHDYSIKGRNCSVQLQAQLPLIGMAFMQDYGALYYEALMLRTHNLVHFASLHNEQDLDVRLTTDIPVSVIPGLRKAKTVVRLGGYYHIETMDINSIINRYSTIGISIGWTWKYLPL